MKYPDENEHQTRLKQTTFNQKLVVGSIYLTQNGINTCVKEWKLDKKGGLTVGGREGDGERSDSGKLRNIQLDF